MCGNSSPAVADDDDDDDGGDDDDGVGGAESRQAELGTLKRRSPRVDLRWWHGEQSQAQTGTCRRRSEEAPRTDGEYPVSTI